MSAADVGGRRPLSDPGVRRRITDAIKRRRAKRRRELSAFVSEMQEAQWAAQTTTADKPEDLR